MKSENNNDPENLKENPDVDENGRPINKKDTQKTN